MSDCLQLNKGRRWFIKMEMGAIMGAIILSWFPSLLLRLLLSVNCYFLWQNTLSSLAPIMWKQCTFFEIKKKTTMMCCSETVKRSEDKNRTDMKPFDYRRIITVTVQPSANHWAVLLPPYLSGWPDRWRLMCWITLSVYESVCVREREHV